MQTPNNTTIIGICGKKFHGKDTVANYLVKNYGFTKISLGDPLKNAMKNIFCFDDEQLWGNSKEVVDKYWSVTPREMMQFIGTDLLRNEMQKKYPQIGDKLWIMSIERYIDGMISKNITKIIIPDLRFPNEEVLIRKYNGKIIRVIRDELIDVIKDAHISENSSFDIKDDYVIHNNNLTHTYEQCENIYLDIAKNL